MVQLFLSEPNWNNLGDCSAVEHIISLLNKLETVIWSLMSSGGRSEARLWLCNALSGVQSITPRQRCEIFMNLLRSKPLRRGLAAQLLQMIFEEQPHKAGPILAKKSYLLENFFRGHPRRILQWFSNFASSGGLEHRKGAKALSQFAFVNRDICWEELEWKGKHGQSPAMVATKPHYFLDLDVERTVENFLEYVPEFWSSVELAESLKDGAIFFIDTKFFVNVFIDLMYKENMKEIWEVINDFLIEEPFSSLCHRLLVIFEERDLSVFVGLMRKFLNPKMEANPSLNPSYWLEIILSNCSDCGSIDQMLLLNAVINQERQLLRLVREEDDEVGKAKIRDIVSQVFAASEYANNLASIIKDGFRTKSIESIKWLGMLSWVIFYRLSEENWTPTNWESLLVSNGIGFRESGKHELLLQSDGSLGEDSSCFNENDSYKVKRKKKKEKRRKKRRKNIDYDENYENEFVEFDLSNSRLDLQSRAGSWLLSTDGYRTSWSSSDLPEHLSKHCFSTWMNWVVAKWRDAT